MTEEQMFAQAMASLADNYSIMQSFVEDFTHDGYIHITAHFYSTFSACNLGWSGNTKLLKKRKSAAVEWELCHSGFASANPQGIALEKMKVGDDVNLPHEIVFDYLKDKLTEFPDFTFTDLPPLSRHVDVSHVQVPVEMYEAYLSIRQL